MLLWGCTSGRVYVPCTYSHARWELTQATLVLCLCDIFQVLINSLACWSRCFEVTLWSNALNLITCHHKACVALLERNGVFSTSVGVVDNGVERLVEPLPEDHCRCGPVPNPTQNLFCHFCLAHVSHAHHTHSTNDLNLYTCLPKTKHPAAFGLPQK